jgi:autotransporter-associated beta strand protein
MLTQSRLLLVLGAALAATASLHAATRSFYCNSGNNNWSAATNWIPNGVPQNGDGLVFSASSPRRDCVNDLANLKLDSLQITANGFEISGNGITVSNGLSIANGTLTYLYTDLTLGKSQTIDVDGASSVRLYSDVNLNGFNLAIDSDSYFETQGAFTGNGNLTKFGTGDLLMAGSPNTFNGSFTHFDGLFSVAKASCLPTNYSSYGITRIYSSGATHTNCHLTLYPGAAMTANSTVTNTIRNLTLHGANMEDTKLHFVLRGNLTNLAASAESHFYGHLDLQNTNHVFHINDGSVDKDLVLAWGGIRGGTSAGFIKTGSGKLHVHDVVNTARGTNQIVAGILEGGMGGGLLGTGRTVVQDGASIQALNGSSMSSYFELHGNGFGGTNGAIRGFGFAHIYGPFLIPTAATVRGDGELHMDGNIGGFGSLRIRGTNEVWTQGAANTLLGGYWVQSGTFVLNKPAGTLAVGSPIDVGSDGFFDVEPATLRNFANEQIATKVTVNPSGTWDLDGHTETVPSLDLYAAAEMSMGNGTLILGGNLEVLPALFASAPATFDGAGYLNVGAGSRNIIVNAFPGGGGGAQELQLLSTTLTGSANIFKQGTGGLWIGYDTAHTGTFTVQEGDVEVAAVTSFGSSGAGTVVTGPGALVMSGSAFSDTEPLIFNGTGRVDSATLVLKDNTSLRGPMMLQQDTRMFVNTNAQFILHSPVGGAGGIIKEGPGELLFDWTQANTFSGGLVIKDGLVTLDRDNTNATLVSAITVGDGLGAAGSARLVSTYRQQIANNVDVTLLSDGRFTITNINEVEIIRRLQGSGQVYISGFGLRLNDSGLDSTFSGTISGNRDLFKAGTGKFTHTGLCNASGLTLSLYGGTTAINGLWNASPTPTLIDAWSGTVLAGTGTVQDVNIRSGATLAPGASPGVFTMNNLSLSNSANLFLEVNGTTPGTQHDQLIAKSSVNISNATLTVGITYPPAEGDVIKLVDNQSATPILGTFSGKPQGSLITSSGNQFVLSYTGGTGNDLTLTATNTKLALAVALIPAGNGLVDAGECNELYLLLTNKSGGTLSSVTATLDSRSPGVAVSQQGATYPNFAANAMHTNQTPFRISTLPGFACGQPVELQLTVTIGASSPFTIPVTLATGNLGSPTSYSSSVATPIPDPGTTNATINVTTFNKYVSKVTVSLHITHGYDADLEVALQSPSGRRVKLVADRGGAGDNFGTNCSPITARTTFDDTSRNAIAVASAPFVGTFSPEEPLSEFKGEFGNGVWKLILTDDAGSDPGTLNCWTLTLYEATCAADSASPCEPCLAPTVGALGPNSPALLKRLYRDAPTICGDPKPCPGTSVSSGPFRYATHTFTNTGPGGCVTVLLHDLCGNNLLFASAYSGGFNPADVCINYLADVGTNLLAPTMSFYVVSNGVFTIVVNELSPNLACSSYTLDLFGLPCPPPALNIAPAGTSQVRLFWNVTGSEGYSLQAAPASGSATFTNLGIPPVLLNGTYHATNNTGSPQQFFRLRKP